MNNLIFLLIIITIFAGTGFYSEYQKNCELDKRLLKLEINYALQKKPAMQDSSQSELPLSKRINELNQLEELKKIISEMKIEPTFISRCLEKIEFEIELQKYSSLKELGIEVYKSTK